MKEIKMVETIIKTVGSITEKGVDVYGKLRCGENIVTSNKSNAGQSVYAGIFSGAHTDMADVELTKVYKQSAVLDEIRRARLQKILEGGGDIQTQKEELRELENEMIYKDNIAEDRASNAEHRKSVDGRFSAVVIAATTVGATVVPFIAKKILKRI